LFSAVLGLVVIPASLALGAFLVLRGRLILHMAGYALTILAWTLAPAEIIESIIALLGNDVPTTLHVIATIGGASAVAWFLSLAFWPRLVAKGVRSD